MTKKQTFLLKMFNSVEKFLKGTSFESQSKVANIMEDFRIKIASIEIITLEQEKADSVIKEKLCKAGADIELLLAKSAKTQGYGYGIELSATLFYSSLMRKNKENLIESLKKVHSEGCKKMDILNSHGITPIVMEYFNELITDYSIESSVTIIKRTNEKRLRLLFTEIEVLLKMLDKEAERYQKENSDFYIAYSANRVPISSSKINSTKLKGLVLDEESLPVEGAIVVIHGTEYKAKTDDCGYYYFQNIPLGTLKVIASAHNHKEEAINISIHKTRSNKINFTLRNEIRNLSNQRYAG